MACLDNQAALESSYTSTGVKDKISQHWISELLEKAKLAHHEQLSDRNTRDRELNDPKCKGSQPNEFVLLPENDRNGMQCGVSECLDPHRDTPGEILHTYLLGNDKYVWHNTTKNWDNKKGDIFASRLQSSSINGLSIPPPRPRYIYSLRTPLLFDLWKATGELGAVLWFPEIKNMDVYLSQADLEVLINNVLDLWGLIDPNRILVKGKLHALTHLGEDARRFGPSVLYATEIFECWNSIFRLCSILPNHLSPSHDIAVTLADMERFKHMSSDRCRVGFWVFIRKEQILAREGSTLTQRNNVFLIIEPYIVLDVKDRRLNMPILLPLAGAAAVAVNSNEIMMSFNVQHDCVACDCRPEKVHVRQEHIVTDRTELQIAHTAEQRFIVNMHGLHSAHLIREVLPRTLTAPVPYLQDHSASHQRFAATLRETGPARRAEIRAKTQATRAKNKEGRIVLASAQAKRQQDEQGHGEHLDMEEVMMTRNDG
ncbi:hypothetical protein DFH09DRAFT_1078464 [Mycena vulgaris]|nr:hypothetical protein DFH09DRAFT_1078464 [Mycena vulgaris]